MKLVERINDVCHFINTFQTAISTSAPHTYLSTGPFLPSDSPLSVTVFSTWFERGIEIQRGRLLSWALPPLGWKAHTDTVRCVSYSPNGRYIVSGSSDRTIQMWDAETGFTVGGPLKGHTDWVRSVAYSPNGYHIISGSDDMTIRIWDAEIGSAVGEPLKGHTDSVRSICGLLS